MPIKKTSKPFFLPLPCSLGEEELTPQAKLDHFQAGWCHFKMIGRCHSVLCVLSCVGQVAGLKGLQLFYLHLVECRVRHQGPSCLFLGESAGRWDIGPWPKFSAQVTQSPGS